MSSTPRPLSVRTMQSIALATLSQWPHQRTTQRNRNDRLFIIAQPLCWRGKSIIKTRLTAKITAVFSIVLERAKFFFPQGSLDQSSITLVQFAPHPKSHCLLELDLPDSFTQWMDSPSEKKKKKERFCVKLPEESGGFGFVRYLSLSAINLPTGRTSSLQGRTGDGVVGLALRRRWKHKLDTDPVHNCESCPTLWNHHWIFLGLPIKHKTLLGKNTTM